MSKRESDPLPEAEADAKKMKPSDEAAQDAHADNERFCDTCQVVHPFHAKDSDDVDDDSDDVDEEEPIDYTNLLIKRLYIDLVDGTNSLTQCASVCAADPVSRRDARIAIWEVDRMVDILTRFKREFEAEVCKVYK
jgi:ferredoxin